MASRIAKRLKALDRKQIIATENPMRCELCAYWYKCKPIGSATVTQDIVYPIKKCPKMKTEGKNWLVTAVNYGCVMFKEVEEDVEQVEYSSDSCSSNGNG